MKREAIMCDTPECHSEATVKCAACKQDVCTGSLSHGAKLQFGGGSFMDAALDTGLVMCLTCLNSLKLDPAQERTMLRTLEPFVEFLSARMAGNALGTIHR